MPQVDGKPGQGPKRSEIELLPYCLIRIARARRHQGGEIFDFPDRVSREQQLAERPQVDPLIAGFAKRSVVEVEAVNINVCCYTGLQTCKSRPEAASRPATEATGGIYALDSPYSPENQAQPGFSAFLA
jgi:hypothetical protein